MPVLRIATWNVNSIRVRLAQLTEWLAARAPDVVCLQETKVPDEQFPRAEIEAAGYHAAISGQKSYNGVAILSRAPLAEVTVTAPGLDGEQKRYLAATVNGVRVVNVYVPNGEAVDSPKYAFKLGWLAALRTHLADELKRHPQLALLGDYNIAPEDRDVHDPESWAGQVLCSDPERAAFRELIALGLVDGFRQFPQPDQSFSWWDYRMGGFRRNHGLRIDHVLLSDPLKATLRACSIDTGPRALERPSDHAPVLVELEI